MGRGKCRERAPGPQSDKEGTAEALKFVLPRAPACLLPLSQQGEEPILPLPCSMAPAGWPAPCLCFTHSPRSSPCGSYFWNRPHSPSCNAHLSLSSRKPSPTRTSNTPST